MIGPDFILFQNMSIMRSDLTDIAAIIEETVAIPRINHVVTSWRFVPAYTSSGE